MARIEIPMEEYKFLNEKIETLEKESIALKNESESMSRRIESLKDTVLELCDTGWFERLFGWRTITQYASKAVLSILLLTMLTSCEYLSTYLFCPYGDTQTCCTKPVMFTIDQLLGGWQVEYGMELESYEVEGIEFYRNDTCRVARKDKMYRRLGYKKYPYRLSKGELIIGGFRYKIVEYEFCDLIIKDSKYSYKMRYIRTPHCLGDD